MAALGTRLLTLTLDGVEVTAQISNCRIVSGASDSDFTSFQDAREGGAREYRLQGTAAQDLDEGTVWDLIWNAAGTTVPAVIDPAGDTPGGKRFTGNVVITEPDGDLLGGEANASTTAKFTLDVDWAFTAKPVMTTIS